MIDPILQKDVEQIIEQYMSRKQYTNSRIPNHEHNGTDSVKLNPKDFLGFPVISAVPTDVAINGTLRVYRSGSTYRIYVRINNLWKYVALT